MFTTIESDQSNEIFYIGGQINPSGDDNDARAALVTYNSLSSGITAVKTYQDDNKNFDTIVALRYSST